MSRIAYVNGQYLPHADAAIHVEDRGNLFADAVYEVVSIVNGKMADLDGHMDRLGRSMGEIRIDWPMSRAAMLQVMRRMVRVNLVKNGLLYLQVSRGAARRDFPFPEDAYPTVIMTCAHKPVWKPEVKPIHVITVPDIRWKRCDIKTVGLLAPVLAKQAAKDAGAQDAWMVDEEGYVTEGASNNAWIVTKEGVLVTRQATSAILRGITRMSVLDIAEEQGLKFEERRFTPEEAYEAKEAFITSASTFVTAVGQINDQVVGNGASGELTNALRKAYLDQIARTGS